MANGKWKMAKPDEAAIRERQHRERSGVREALVGDVFMKLARRDVGDDGGLLVVPARGFDAERLADAGIGAVSCHQEACAQGAGRLPVGFDLQSDRLRTGGDFIDTRRTEDRDRGIAREPLPKCSSEHAVSEHEAERRDALLRRIDARETEAALVGNVDAPDRRCFRRHDVPHAHAVDDAAAAI